MGQQFLDHVIGEIDESWPCIEVGLGSLDNGCRSPHSIHIFCAYYDFSDHIYIQRTLWKWLRVRLTRLLTPEPRMTMRNT
jgi:hypothetical protein